MQPFFSPPNPRVFVPCSSERHWRRRSAGPGRIVEAEHHSHAAASRRYVAIFPISRARLCDLLFSPPNPRVFVPCSREQFWRRRSAGPGRIVETERHSHWTDSLRYVAIFAISRTRLYDLLFSLFNLCVFILCSREQHWRRRSASSCEYKHNGRVWL